MSQRRDWIIPQGWVRCQLVLIKFQILKRG
jgi:hypothetical protein